MNQKQLAIRITWRLFFICLLCLFTFSFTCADAYHAITIRAWNSTVFLYLPISSKKNLCKHSPSKIFDKVDILSEKLPCFTDKILGYKNYLDTFFNYLRWLNTVFDTCVLFTFFSKTLDPSVVKNGSKQVNSTNIDFLMVKLTYVPLPWQHE